MNDSATVVLPTDVRQLKIEIGKSILEAMFRGVGFDDEQIKRVVDRSPDSHHIEAAERAQSDHPVVMLELKHVTDQALRDLDMSVEHALMVIISEMMKQRYLAEFLVDLPYLADLFKGMSTLDITQFRSVLQIIHDYAEGK